MSPQSREDQIIELTDIFEEGDPLEPSDGGGQGAGIEAELNDLFADFDSNRTSSEAVRKSGDDDDIDFDAIFSEEEEISNGDEASLSHPDQEDEGLDLDSLFKDDLTSSEDKERVITSTETQGFELDSLFDNDPESGDEETAPAPQAKDVQVAGLDDLFLDEGNEDETVSLDENSSGEELLELDAIFEEEAKSGFSRSSGMDMPEFDGTVEEIEEFDLSEVSAEFAPGKDEHFTSEPEKAAEPEPASRKLLLDQEELFSEAEEGGGGADLSELDALIAGLEGEEQAEEDLPAPGKQELVLDVPQEFKLEDDDENGLPKDLLEAGFEPQAVDEIEQLDHDLESLLPRIEKEVMERVEERMTAVHAEWAEREQNLLLAIDRMEKENESLRSMVEDSPASVSPEELAQFKQELKEELAEELKKLVPSEAAKVIREEISALMKAISDE
jgi:pilus assembly protein FimV